MQTLFFRLTDNCNDDCEWCFDKQVKSEKHSEKPKLTNEFIKNKLIKKISETGFSGIIFTGGEPLIDENLIDYIGISSKYNIETILLTNGQLLNEDNLEKLKNVSLTSLTLSLNKLAVRNIIKKNFDKTLQEYIEKSNLIKKYIPNYCVTAVITKNNFKFANIIFKKFSELEIPVVFQPVYIDKMKKYYAEYTLDKLTEENWKEFKELLSDWTIKYNTYNYMQLIYDLYNSRHPKNLTCYMGSKAIVLDSYGDVYPCFHRRDLNLGNVTEKDFKDIIIKSFTESEDIMDLKCIGKHCISLFIDC